MTAPSDPWTSSDSGPAPQPYQPGRARRPPVGRYVRRLVVRLVGIAIIVTGLAYLFEWGRFELGSTDGWVEQLSGSGEYTMMLPREPIAGNSLGSSTLTVAADDWEVFFAEGIPGGDDDLANIFGNAATSESIGPAAKGTMDRLGGKVTSADTGRHRFGKGFVEFTGVYTRLDGVDRYLHQIIIVAPNGNVLTLKVEANRNRDQLADFLFRNVEDTLELT